MKILFTGASSFTGYWFAKELINAGHDVTVIFRGSLENYTGTRRQRIDLIPKKCHTIFNCSFGDDRFLEAIASEKHWDLLCHHGADVTNYKSPDFDAVKALANNTHHIKRVLVALKEKKCRKVLLTGSVFEQGEGAGSDGLRAVSPYGLSKGLTSEAFKFYCAITDMKLGKFVIPNPFGPYEEVRFTTFLIQNWLAGKVAPVSSPAYVRDNIHVSLLAKAYLYFAEKLDATLHFEKFNPSGYDESQGAFTLRFAAEMRKRLNIPCEVDLQHQTEFPEPQVRINTDLLNDLPLNWDETQAWDELADYYRKLK
jgi:nucleoside-diphosphate-sugar epimerase